MNKKLKQEARRLAVAMMAANGRSQDEIAEVLHTSQSTVSRILLKDNPHIEPPSNIPRLEIKLDGLGLDAAEQELVEEYANALAYQTGTADVLKKISPDREISVHVAHDAGNHSRAENHSMPETGRLLGNLLQNSSLVGVAWDIRVNEMQGGISLRRHKSNSESPIDFIPVCGITHTRYDVLQRSSTVVASLLQNLVNRGFDEEELMYLNLNCIPLVHPSKNGWTHDHPRLPESAGAIEYIKDAFPDYIEIFGDVSKKRKPTGLANKVDTIITGIGSVVDADVLLDYLYTSKTRNSRRSKFIPGTKIERNTLINEIIVGDIAGILIPRIMGVSKQTARYNMEETRNLNKRLATLNDGHVKECANSKKGGVIVIADGERSVDVLITAIKLGYVSTAIIDSSLSQKLSMMADKLEFGID